MIELKKIENLYIQRAIVRTNITKTLNKGSAYMFINNGEENTVNDIRNFLSKKTKFVPFGNIKTVVEETNGNLEINTYVNLLSAIENFKTDLKNKISSYGITTNNDMTFSNLLDLIDSVKS